MAENREHQLVEGDAVMRVSGGGHFKQKSIKSKFVSISLRDKLIFLFVGTLFVELLLFGCVMSFYLYINAKKNVSDNIDTTVTAVSEVMDQSFLVMENLVLELAASNGVQNWLDDSHYYDRENSEFYLRKEILNSTFLDHKVVVAEGESGMLIFVIEYKGSEENAAWFQRRLEKVVSIAKIFQNIRLRIGAGKVVKSAEWGRVGKKQAIRNLSDIYTDNSPVNVKENYTEYIQYWKDENDVESYMRRLYVALRSGMEENKKLCAEEFEEYLKQETRPIEQCRSDTHAIILYLVRKVKSKEKMEKILVPEKALDAVYRSKSKAALAEVMRETCEAISTILEEEQKEGSSLSRKVNSIIERDYRGKISLKDIGKELFVNSSYLSRVYKKETGYTVTDAINSYRIEKAKEILETGEYRVCEVGEMVGIEDPAYFTHVFLKYEGKSPSDFMNR